MAKVVLLDLDGVVLEPTKEYFSVWYAREYGVPLEEIAAFFKSDFRKCQAGELDLKEEIARYLPGWKWEGSVEEFLKLWFEQRDLPKQEVLDGVVRKLHKNGVKVYLASNQEKYRGAHIWNKIKNDFDGAFYSSDIKALKKQPEFWEEVLKTLDNPDPATIDYWDDDPENVEAAKKFGIQARVFENEEQLGIYR